jgi:hypothetical protein
MLQPTERSILTAVRHVAMALQPQLHSIGEGTASHIAALMPELSQPGAFELVRTACHANSRLLLDALSRGLPPEKLTPSTEVMLATRAMVQYGINHDSVMRGYRLGTAYWCRRWGDAVEQHCSDASLAVPVTSHGTIFLLDWLEVASTRLGAEFRDETERQAREGSLAWAAYVRSVLNDDGLDVRDASLRLGYDLEGYHVALVLSHYQSGSHTALDSAAFELARAVSRLKPLVVRVDVDTTWCWIPSQAVLNLPASRAAILVGQGRPGTGLSGFRRSHREAVEALRVARLATSPAGSVTRFHEVELAALCSNDAAYCRAFVAETLGRLAAQTEEIQKLRATLEAYFKANCNFRGAAVQLGLHHNTVRYRLDRAADLLGRSLEEDRLQLELALHLASRLGLGKKPEGPVSGRRHQATSESAA